MEFAFFVTFFYFKSLRQLSVVGKGRMIPIYMYIFARIGNNIPTQ